MRDPIVSDRVEDLSGPCNDIIKVVMRKYVSVAWPPGPYYSIKALVLFSNTSLRQNFSCRFEVCFLSFQSQIYEEIILGDRNYIYNTVLTL